MREGQTCDRYRFWLFCLNVKSLLWLRQHVQTPRAHLAVCWDTDQVVSILSANDIQTVNWMLKNQRLLAVSWCIQRHKIQMLFQRIISMHTVWALADNGVRWIGVLFCTRLSQRTIWPEYVPPRIKFGWNLAKVVDITGDWQWKIYSGVVFLNLVFQTRHTPSGSFGVSSLFV